MTIATALVHMTDERLDVLRDPEIATMEARKSNQRIPAGSQAEAQMERLAQIGQMVTGVAHESRNALQRALAELDLMSLDMEDRPAEMTQLSRVRKALDDLAHLYEELRQYATPIHLEIEECNLAAVWRLTWENLRFRRNGHSIDLLEDVQATELNCHIDEDRMVQVFRNILENAIAACPEFGRIVVECISTRLAGQLGLQIVFRDNGPGLPDGECDRIFDPFFTTKKNGTGLGMAIAARIVAAHGGQIEARNAPGRGAEFIVSLPHMPYCHVA
jgi:signal transduction histidine kinase